MRNRQHARKSSISGLARPTAGEVRRESGLIRRNLKERLEVETPVVLTVPPLSAPGDRIDYMKVARLRALVEANELPIDAQAIAGKLAVTGLADLPAVDGAVQEPAVSGALPRPSEVRQDAGRLSEPPVSEAPRRRASRRPRKS